MTPEQRKAAFEREYAMLKAKYGIDVQSAMVVTQGGQQQLVAPVLVPVAGWVDATPQNSEQ